VISEDSVLTDQQMYWSVIGAIAEGNERRADIARVVDRPSTSLSHSLTVLIDAGWVDHRTDPLHGRRSTYRLADPIVRFWRLVVEPNTPRLTIASSAPAQVWRESDALVASRIYGPHLETLASEWLLGGGVQCGLRENPTEVGSSEVVISGRRDRLDLVAVRRTGAGRPHTLAIGEVKATGQPVGPSELDRLDTVAAAIEPTAMRVLVARSGFTAPLRRLAERRSDVILADLATLYR
jgi:uncharacterized protein